MSSLLDLPDELILEVLSYTEIAEVLKCGQVSKRIRTISDDNSLFQVLNLCNSYFEGVYFKDTVYVSCFKRDQITDYN